MGRGGKGEQKSQFPSVRPRPSAVRCSLPRFEKMHIWPNRMTTGAARTRTTSDSQTSHKVLLKRVAVGSLLSSLFFPPRMSTIAVVLASYFHSGREKFAFRKIKEESMRTKGGVASAVCLHGDVVIFVQFSSVPTAAQRRIHFDNSHGEYRNGVRPSLRSVRRTP